jgi:hypothetical protein
MLFCQWHILPIGHGFHYLDLSSGSRGLLVKYATDNFASARTHAHAQANAQGHTNVFQRALFLPANCDGIHLMNQTSDKTKDAVTPYHVMAYDTSCGRH